MVHEWYRSGAAQNGINGTGTGHWAWYGTGMAKWYGSGTGNYPASFTHLPCASSLTSALQNLYKLREYDIQEANFVQVLSRRGFLQRTGAPYAYMTRWASLGQESELPCPIQAICFEYAVDMHRELVATSARANWGYLGTTFLRDWTILQHEAVRRQFLHFISEDISSIVLAETFLGRTLPGEEHC